MKKYPKAVMAYNYTFIAENYPKMNARQICLKLGTSFGYVGYALDLMGIERVKPDLTTRWKPEVVAALVAKFKECGSVAEAAEAFGIKGSTHAWDLIREAGVDVKEFNKRHLTARHKDLSTKIPRTKLAYYIGLISADGCLIGDGNVALGFQGKDKKELEDFAGSIAEPPLNVTVRRKEKYIVRSLVNGQRIKQQQDFYAVSACLPDLYDECLKVGLTPKKSLTLQVDLSCFTDEEKLYYLRGAIDGDGHVHLNPNGGLTGCVVGLLSASKPYIEYLQKLFGGRVRISKRGHEGFADMAILCFSSSGARIMALNLPVEDYMLKRKSDRLVQLRSLTPGPRSRIKQLSGEIWKK